MPCYKMFLAEYLNATIALLVQEKNKSLLERNFQSIVNTWYLSTIDEFSINFLLRFFNSC